MPYENEDAKFLDEPQFIGTEIKRPQRGGTPAVWWEPVEKLMDRPGEWAIIRKGRGNQIRPMASNLRLRKVRYPEGIFEFDMIHDPDYPPEMDNRRALVGRYIGPEPTPSDGSAGD